MAVLSDCVGGRLITAVFARVVAGDGSIDVDEFTQVCTCYGATKAECQQAFQRFSKVRTCVAMANCRKNHVSVTKELADRVASVHVFRNTTKSGIPCHTVKKN